MVVFVLFFSPLKDIVKALVISIKHFWSLLLFFFFFSSVGVDVSAGRFTDYFIYYL